jgi:histidinol phosphatase-like enzyme
MHENDAIVQNVAARKKADELVEFLLAELSDEDESQRAKIGKLLYDKLTAELGIKPKIIKMVDDKLKPYNKHELAEAMETALAFGKFAGIKIQDVPRDYLEWLCDSSRETYRMLRRLLTSDAVLTNTANDD